MKRYQEVVLAMFLVCGLAAETATAASMRSYVFEGKLTSVQDPMSVFDPSIQVGSPFTMTVTLAADTPNMMGDNPQLAQQYGHYNVPAGAPGAGFSISINGQPFVFSSPPMDGQVSVTNGSQFYGHQFFGLNAGPDVYPMRLDFGLYKNGQVFSSSALPETLNLADFSSATVFLPVWTPLAHWKPGEESSLLGSIEKVTILGGPSPAPIPVNDPSPVPIPEPSLVWIFGAAFAGWIGVRHARRR